MNRSDKVKMLLDKYFEGNTSLREERHLRDCFSSETADKEFDEYAPIFQYFKMERVEKAGFRRFYDRDIMLRTLISAVACVLLVLGIVLSPDRASVVEDEFGCVGTYVRIEGTCYNDINLVFSHAAQAISDLDILLAEDHSGMETNNNEK